MFDTLEFFTKRPGIFDGADTAALWADPHVARQMLALHLEPGHGIASRPHAEIAEMAGWIADDLDLRGKRLTDLGCGPGLYAAHFAAAGADVTGLDLSEIALDHARRVACPVGTFRCANYLDDPLPGTDVATLIYGDVCALSPAQRGRLFAKVRGALAPGGTFVLDAFPPAQFETREEDSEVALRLMDGFWAAGDYVGLRRTYLYPEHSTALDRYLIVEPHRQRQVDTWLQYLSPEALTQALEAAGFRSEPARDAVSGQPWAGGGRPFALVAHA
ncbi:SAM-dependent methyltransferase [Tropicimonas marinistellae]|uniref:SAM-dependent methyltransferase n=1 Tax=Tropicimonas marinistellae TaxID=1739787 RepID=UPI000837064C|nr:class I SAM-dependent methyltransferase [Tropicimonas marinistellae]